MNGSSYNGLNWADQIKSMLKKLGFNYVWNHQNLDNITYNEMKRRIFDSANHQLTMTINTCIKLLSYCLFKADIEHEMCLNTNKQI